VSALTGTIVRLAARGAARRFTAAAADVERSQLAVLRSILQRNANTEYGRRHGFAKIDGVAAFRGAVPVVVHADLDPFVQRMANGERGVLTAEDPVMFAMTSGTEGKPKLIPVTPTCRDVVHRDQMRTWLWHALQDHPRMLDGKVLSLVSPAEEGRTAANLPYGSTSGTIYRDLPWFVRRGYLVPYEVFTIEDYLAKYYVIMRLGLAARVTFVSTANPSSIAKLCEVTDEHAEQLIADVHDGTLNEAMNVPAPVRRLLAPLLHADRYRARELTAMRGARGGHLLPGDYWPDLQLLGCWKGGTVGHYVQRFPQWFAPEGRAMVAVRDWGYLSSEARCSVPIRDDGAGGVLSVASNFYEFVAAEDVAEFPDDRERWTFLGAHEIEEPGDYNVFLTTTGGLYRYDINDVVRVVDRYDDAPVIEFVRKGGGVTSLTGEKLTVTQIKVAIEGAADANGVTVEHYRALAVVADSRYEFEVQFGSEVDQRAAESFVRDVERRLREQNLEYEGKRASLRLGPPRLHVMKPGWHDAEKERQGRRLFQSKTVLLKAVESAEERRSREFRRCTATCEEP